MGPLSLEKTGRAVEEIVPRGFAELGYPSLSAIYGRNSLPWHIDTAHWLKPARYLVLGCAQEGTKAPPTNLLEWSGIRLSPKEQETAVSAPFRVRNGRYSFYSTLIAPGSCFFRHDPGCMEPLSDGAAALQHRLAWEGAQGLIIEVKWQIGRILLFDNWRFFHRRPDASDSAGRKLLRAYADGDSPTFLPRNADDNRY